MSWHKNEVWAMADTRPGYVDSYLEGLAGPGEQHQDPNKAGQYRCMNPKCLHEFSAGELDEAEWQGGMITCPQCGFQNKVAEEPLFQRSDPSQTPGGRPYTVNPDARTRAGLTLTEMGDIGESVVFRLGEIPGVGMIKPAGDTYHFAIDGIIETPRGNFGVEIKSNHSQAKERFRIGDAKERAAKIQYCLEHGLKPAIVGVRLNFYTDKAYVFFREGMTDTWIGNQKMMHVGTFDFADLNPFKSPDPEAQALAVKNAELPDQDVDADIPF